MMEDLQSYPGYQEFNVTQPMIYILVLLAIWDLVWKLIAMWKAGRNNHLAWYIGIAVLNTVGILPIVYILINRNKTNRESKETDAYIQHADRK